MDDVELREIKRIARRKRLTVAEWVRQTLREARRREPQLQPDRKLGAVREASQHGYPSADIAQMLTEIERGYLESAE